MGGRAGGWGTVVRAGGVGQGTEVNRGDESRVGRRGVGRWVGEGGGGVLRSSGEEDCRSTH